MSTVTANGRIVPSMSVTIPMYGAWVADVVLGDPAPLTSPVTLVLGDLTLVGTVIRQDKFTNDVSARIVGGAAGWRKEIPAKGYAHEAGIKLSSVLSDAARECGESIVVSKDRTLGLNFAREKAPAERMLHLLTDALWWIDSKGITQTGARASDKIVTPFTVLNYSGGMGQFEISSEAISPWQPGRTFTCNTVPETQTISSVTITGTNEGIIKLHVLSTSVAVERLRTDIRAMIRAEIASLSYGFVWEYTVSSSNATNGTVDATPSDARMPPLTKVPLAPELGAAAPSAGSKCRIRFVNADPSRPEVVSFGSSTEHLMTTEACALLIYNTLGAIFTAAGGGPMLSVALLPLVTPSILAALSTQGAAAPSGLAAQTAAAAAQTPLFALAGPASTCAPFTSAIAAIQSKTPDVSGLFPSLGVPNGG